MNKKLLALAVAGATFAPAVMAQTANPVTLYGTLNVDFESVKATGAAGTGANASTRNRVSTNSANLGFRGTEDLGGGLKAFFQIESAVPFDTGGGTFASRNSAVGLQGPGGSVLLGNWDTPYKSITGDADAMYNTGIANVVNITSGNATPTGAPGTNRNAFDRRSNNSFQYWSPTFNGFSGRFAYSANEGKTASNALVKQNPSLVSLSGSYSAGPFYVALAHERHTEFGNSASSLSHDKGLKLAATFTFGATKIGFITEQLKFKGNVVGLAGTTPLLGLPKSFTAGTASEAKINASYISLRHSIGKHTLRAAYGADRGVKLNGGSANQTKAQMNVLGYSYTFSKRTDFYAVYSKIKNEVNSRNDFAINGVGGVANGADPSGIGAGFRHTF